MAMMNEMEYRTIGSALAGGYRAAVYCRLSKDDDLQGESASIANNLNLAMVTIYTFLLFFCCFGCYKGEKPGNTERQIKRISC